MKLTHTTRKINTINCEVRFALTKAQMQIVRKHYGVKDGVVLTFGGRCEIYEQGNGWWAAFSTNDVVDGALRAIINIEAALRIYAERLLDASNIVIRPAPAVAPIKESALIRRYQIQQPTRSRHEPHHTQSR